MNRAVLVFLLIALFQSTSLAGPIDRLQSIFHSEIQSEAVERGHLAESQNAGLRLRRAITVAPKTPDRICTGCFSVIGDPTKPQQ